MSKYDYSPKLMDLCEQLPAFQELERRARATMKRIGFEKGKVPDETWETVYEAVCQTEFKLSPALDEAVGAELVGARRQLGIKGPNE